MSIKVFVDDELWKTVYSDYVYEPGLLESELGRTIDELVTEVIAANGTFVYLTSFHLTTHPKAVFAYSVDTHQVMTVHMCYVKLNYRKFTRGLPIKIFELLLDTISQQYRKCACTSIKMAVSTREGYLSLRRMLEKFGARSISDKNYENLIWYEFCFDDVQRKLPHSKNSTAQ